MRLIKFPCEADYDYITFYDQLSHPFSFQPISVIKSVSYHLYFSQYISVFCKFLEDTVEYYLDLPQFKIVLNELIKPVVIKVL